jgi:dipeptide/tripeptide permease
MYWTQAVDLYCERTGPGLWAEPINAISNAAFVIVGLAMLAKARSSGSGAWVQVLCVWAAAIGAGSFLFHILANRWSELADVIPIWSFIFVYVVFTLRRLFDMPWGLIGRVALISLASILLVMWLLPESSGEATNESIQYLPAVAALAAFAGALVWSGKPGAGLVLAACGVFALSLLFRSIDLDVCDRIPIGTHFLWHILNAAMVGLLLIVAVLYGDRPSAARG